MAEDANPTCASCGEDVCPTCEGDGWVHDPSDGGTMCCPDCEGQHECDENEE